MRQSETEISRPGLRLWGPVSGLGLFTAVTAYLLDQGHKYWMLEVYRIAERGRVEVTGFFDLVLAWNHGISYGLFAQHDATGRTILILLSIAATIALGLWLANSANRLAAVALGLIIGGALGNLTDRIVHGAVADFFHFHYGAFSWYIFNIADVAIVAGVIGLLLDWMRLERA